jgi:hypothetical protein
VAHRREAEADIARAERDCRPTTPSADGRYLARTRAACGAQPYSVTVEIEHGQIHWRHEYQGADYPWDGTIDASGTIQGLVRGSSDLRATGHFNDDEREVKMVYPQCAPGITMEIVNKMPN